MLLELVFIILLSAIPAAFNYFLNYCLGEPMSNEPSPKAIFSRYSLFIAKRRLKKMDALKPIADYYLPMLTSPNLSDSLDAEKQMNQAILLGGQKYYTYEQALGMCPFCTGFWCALISAFLFFLFIPFQHFNPLILFILIPIFAHLILRKI